MRKIPNLKLSLGGILAVLALLAIAVMPVMADVVSSPCSGTVTIDGSPAPDTSGVRVYVGAETAHRTETATVGGLYEAFPLGDESDVGKALSFKVRKAGEVDWRNATTDPPSPTYLYDDLQFVDLIAGEGPTQYWLTTASTVGGWVDVPGEGTYGPYNSGQVVPLEAVADAGYVFDEWTGGDHIANRYASTTTITMYGNYEIWANFEEVPPGPYDLTIHSTVGGSVDTPGEGTFGPYDSGDVQLLEATADAGYVFDEWTGGDHIADRYAATTTITMYGNYEIWADFEEVVPPAPGVGGTPYPPDKFGILAPWIALGLAIIAGALIVMRRRRAYN